MLKAVVCLFIFLTSLYIRNRCIIFFACHLTFCLHCNFPVADTGLDSDIQHLNHSQLDKYYQSLLTYPADSDLSNGQCYPADSAAK